MLEVGGRVIPSLLNQLTSNMLAICVPQARADLATHLGAHDEKLADVAFTLQVGRGEFEYRRVVACDTVGPAVRALGGERRDAVWSGRARASGSPPTARPSPCRAATR